MVWGTGTTASFRLQICVDHVDTVYFQDDRCDLSDRYSTATQLESLVTVVHMLVDPMDTPYFKKHAGSTCVVHLGSYFRHKAA
jgi:hypothetical protein